MIWRPSIPTKSRWEITASDLPTAEAMAREPCLRNLEDNAIFRLGRITSRRVGPRLVLILLIGALIVLILLRSAPDDIIGASLFFLTLFWLQVVPTLGTENWCIRSALIPHVLLTLLTPDDYVAGLWGVLVARRGYLRQTSLLWGVGMFCASGYFWLDAGSTHWCSLGLFVVFLTLGAVRAYPYHVVPILDFKFLLHRRFLERGEQSSSFTYQLQEFTAKSFFLIILAVPLALVALILVLAITVTLHLFPAPAGGPFAAGAGWLIGLSVSALIRRNTDSCINHLYGNVEAILRLQAAES